MSLGKNRGGKSMKKSVGKVLLMSVLCSIFFGTSLYAQEMNKDEKVDVTRSIIQSERESIISSTMKLSEEEREKFWPLYNEYRSEMSKVNERSVKLITEYLEHYGEHSDEKARAMMNEFLEIKKADLDLKMAYVKKFSDALPPTTTLKFFQLENRMDAVVTNQLINQIPLVK
jgi:hypothetical protein